MKQIVKVLSAIGVLGAVMWLGGTFIRYAIAYDVFIPGTLIQKPDFTQEMLLQTVRIYAFTAFYTLSGYGAACLGVLLFLTQSWAMMRKKGWMFMMLILFLLAMPAEIYLLLYDIELIKTLQSTSDMAVKGSSLIQIFLKRFSPDGLANQAGTLTIFAYITGLIFLVFKPLDSSSSHINDINNNTL